MEKPLRTAAQRNVSCHWVVGGECWRHHWDRSCAGTKPHTSFPPPLALSRSRRGSGNIPWSATGGPGKQASALALSLGSARHRPRPAGASRWLPRCLLSPSLLPLRPEDRATCRSGSSWRLAYWFQWSLPLKNLGNGYSLSLLFLETAKQHERTVSL